MASRDATFEQTGAVATMTPLAVWFRLLRHHLRLLAPSSIVWILLLTGSAAFVAGFWVDNFPTEEDRISLAQSVEGNPAFEAMFGKGISLETIEGFTMWRAGGPLIPAIAIWGLLVATRLGRGDEDKGHDELLLGGVLSRQALLGSAIAALAIVISIYTLLTGLTLVGVSEITTAGGWRYAFATGVGFAFFATLGALLVQITPNRSIALRIGLGLIGLAIGVRILSVLETMPSWLPWTTPFGWFSEVGPPGDGSDVPFLLFSLGTVLFGVGALTLSGRRELHGSMLLQESESAHHTRPYDSLWVHETRQTLPAFIGFGAVGLLLSAIFALVTNDFVEFIDEFPAFADALRGFGLDDPSDPSAFIGLIVSLMVLVVTLYAAGHVASMRDDEASGRLATLLTLPLERSRWLVVNTLVGLGAVVIISLLIGLGSLVGSAITGTMLDPGDALRAGLNLIPIAVLFIGLAILIFGLYPPLTAPLIYIVMLTTYLVVMMDAFLDMPGWIIALSPFEHLALVPGEAANLTVSALFLLIGIAGGIVGFLAFRSRDLRMD